MRSFFWDIYWDIKQHTNIKCKVVGQTFEFFKALDIQTKKKNCPLWLLCKIRLFFFFFSAFFIRFLFFFIFYGISLNFGFLIKFYCYCSFSLIFFIKLYCYGFSSYCFSLACSNKRSLDFLNRIISLKNAH